MPRKRAKDKCWKCKENDGLGFVVHPADHVPLCRFCLRFFEDHPYLHIEEFLNGFKGKEGQSIRKAHKDRMLGKDPWQNSSRIQKMKSKGLIGCLNETGINSENYKNFLNGDNKAEPERDRERSKREDCESRCGALNMAETS